MSEYRFDQIAINSTEKKKPEESDKYTYIGLEHLDSMDLEVHRWGSEVAPKGEKLLMKKGDVLFGKRRAYQKKVAIAPFDGIFSAHGMVLRPNEKIVDKDFFPLFISSDYFLDAAIKISVGSLSPTINWRDLRELKFCLPDLETQRKLAKVLWAINATMQNYKVLLAKTDELVKSQFIELFIEGKYGKCREPLKKYIEQIRGVSYKPKDLHPEKDDRSTVLLRANNITSGQINFEEVQYVDNSKVSENQIIRSGDILMCASSGSLEHVGKAALCKENTYGMTFGAFCKLIRCKGTLLPGYVASYFGSDECRESIMSLANGSNINNLKNEHIDELMIPIPELNVQKQFIDFLEQSDKSKFGKEMCDKWILEIQNSWYQMYRILHQ